MSKEEERTKHEERGQEFSPELEALEDARDAFHADPTDEAAKALFKQKQKQVVALRRGAREARELAGPPPGATNVVRDGNGRAIGWNEGPDVAVAPGGVA